MRSTVPRDKIRFLGLTLLVLLYAAFVWGSLVSRGWFDYVGVDYRGFLASAQIVRDHGFAAVYDLGMQEKYQQALYRYARLSSQIPMDVNPTPYLPVFVAAFLALLPFEPVPSFLLWVLVNAIVLVFYPRRLAKQAGLPPSAAMSFVLALPLFFTLFFGQVNVGLLICFGEALISFRRGRDFWGGAWLAGMLLKPQLLALLIPGLLIGKKWRGLFGFVAVGGALILASLWLAGWDGMAALLGLLTGYISSENLATNFPQSMMNWRALAVNVNAMFGGDLGWWITLPGMAVTAIAGIGLWVLRRGASAREYAVLWLGTFAAMAAVAWHSHVHTALPLLAPMIFLRADARLPERLVRWWIYAPAALFLGIVWVYTPIAISLGATNWIGPRFGHIVAGFTFLLLNLVLLGWAWRSLRFQKGGEEEPVE